MITTTTLVAYVCFFTNWSLSALIWRLPKNMKWNENNRNAKKNQVQMVNNHHKQSNILPDKKNSNQIKYLSIHLIHIINNNKKGKNYQLIMIILYIVWSIHLFEWSPKKERRFSKLSSSNCKPKWWFFFGLKKEEVPKNKVQWFWFLI